MMTYDTREILAEDAVLAVPEVDRALHDDIKPYHQGHEVDGVVRFAATGTVGLITRSQPDGGFTIGREAVALDQPPTSEEIIILAETIRVATA